MYLIPMIYIHEKYRPVYFFMNRVGYWIRTCQQLKEDSKSDIHGIPFGVDSRQTFFLDPGTKVEFIRMQKYQLRT